MHQNGLWELPIFPLDKASQKSNIVSNWGKAPKPVITTLLLHSVVVKLSFSMYSIAEPTVAIDSAWSSGIWMSNLFQTP